MIMLAVVDLWNDNGEDKIKKSVGCCSDAGDVFERGRGEDKETRAEQSQCCVVLAGGLEEKVIAVCEEAAAQCVLV